MKEGALTEHDFEKLTEALQHKKGLHRRQQLPALAYAPSSFGISLL